MCTYSPVVLLIFISVSFFLRNIYAYGNITRLNPTTYTRAKIDLMFESYISFYLCFFLRIALCILHLPLVSLFLSF